MTEDNSALALDSRVMEVLRLATTEAAVRPADSPGQFKFKFDSDKTYFFERTVSGWVRVMSSSRRQQPVFIADFAAMEYVNRYFAMLGGKILRNIRGLPMLAESLRASSVSVGSQVQPGTVRVNDEVRSVEILAFGDTPAARFPSAVISRVSQAAGASWFLNHSVAQILASQEDDKGRPLFTVASDVFGGGEV
ncbi:Imm61 family immunity protein [Mycetocola saprophilus]|uniref:Imm61 family immunity protein n=1 Tax=Mycetocola saprophilus TaxID=76636 RepID=UPI0012DDC51D|nr:Imm61 family immunity protein [Mycetocola saprophilus]